MSRIGDFADDDVAGWIRLSPDLGKAMVGFIAHDNECQACQLTLPSRA